MHVSMVVGARKVSDAIGEATTLPQPKKGGLSELPTARDSDVTYGDIFTDKESVYETIEITPGGDKSKLVRMALLDYEDYEVLSL